jgi:anti-sigma B factor antagonist
VEVDRTPDGAVITAHGELDIATAPELQELLDEHSGPLTLDLRDLDFIDSTGLHLLLGAQADPGTELRIVAGPEVHRVFDLAGVRRHFTYVDLD